METPVVAASVMVPPDLEWFWWMERELYGCLLIGAVVWDGVLLWFLFG